MKKKNYLMVGSAVLFLVLFGSSVFAQTTEFKFKGTLVSADVTPDGTYDLEFRLFDAETGGTLLGTQQRLAVTVANWNYSVRLDFGNAFPGAARFLEIAYRTGPDPFTTLSQREPFLSAPYAIRSLRAAHAHTADTAELAADSQQLGGVSSSRYVLTADPRLFDARNPQPGSDNYVQNRTTPAQPNTNFNISGTGVLGGDLWVDGSISTRFYYGIGGSKFISADTTRQDIFIGVNAGRDHTTGQFNSVLGFYSGVLNRTGSSNSFFGAYAGSVSTTGNDNSFFGRSAGDSNDTGSYNSFFGYDAGGGNTKGNSNSFFGRNAGDANTLGDNNTAIGDGADVGSGNLHYATAIGSGAVVSSSNTIQLGRSNGDDFVLIPGRLTLPNLASAGSTQLCRNSNDRVGNCSSSLRYKTNIGRFNSGLGLVNQLKPITFNWIEGGMADLGLGAEDVAAIEPLLVTYNKNGQVEGVKYDRIGVVLLNAVKEQQAQIQRQQVQIDALKALVCLSHPKVEICK